MWTLLPMVSLLIRAIIGNPEIDENTLSVLIGLGNESNDPVTDNRSSNDVWERTINRDNKVETVSDRPKGYDNVNNDKRGDRARGTRTNEDTERSWFELSTRNQGIREGYPQEKASPWLYSRENRRPLGLDGSSISCICRQLRLPSSNKRNDKEYFDRSNVDLQTKRTKLTYDGYGRDTAVDEFNGIKRVAKMRKVVSKTPFNSWGGKRAEDHHRRSIDREQFSQLSQDPSNRHFSNPIKDASPARKYADEIDYEKHAVRMVNGISAVYRNWNRKRNLYPYPVPFRIYNETDEHDVNEQVNGVTDWLIPIRDKKSEQHGQYKKTKFNPWGGKRSSKACTFRFGNNHFTTPACPERRPKGLPSTTGREYV